MTATNYGEDQIANWVNTHPLWVKLHVGDPLEDATANAAANTVRKPVTFAASSGGQLVSNSAVDYPSVPNAETYSYFSLWDAVTLGNPWGSGVLTDVGGTPTPVIVGVGDNVTFVVGSIIWAVE